MSATDSKCRTLNPNIKIACLISYLLSNIWLVVIWTKLHMDVIHIRVTAASIVLAYHGATDVAESHPLDSL